MIIGVEVQDVDNAKELVISYYDANRNIAYMRKRMYDHEIFNWVKSDTPSQYKNWDGAFIKQETSEAKWLTRPRLEELILEKLTPEEHAIIYNPDYFPKKSYTDIEILLTDDTFPDPGKVPMPVGMISFCNEAGVTYILSMMTSDDHPDGLSDADVAKIEDDVNEYIHSVVPHDPNDKEILSGHFKVKHKFFRTEKELLEFYFHKIIPKQAFLTGWNFIDFDWQYLMNRANKIGVDVFENMSSRKTFSKKHKLPTHLGIVDYMGLFIDPGYRPYKVVENFTLDYISNRALNVTKLKHPYKNMMEFQKDVPLFTMYNVIDNILVKLLEDKFELLDVVFAVGNVANIEVNKIFSPVHITEVLMCREFLNSNLRMLKKEWESNKEETKKYDGAFVMKPVPGYYEYITCYDFRSMYPNLQMQFNIGPDAYLGKIDMLKLNGKEITTKNNTAFSNDKDSVSRVILERLYNARIDAQKEIAELKFSEA